MGLLADRFNSEETREVVTLAEWRAMDTEAYWQGQPSGTPAGIAVTRDIALSVTTFWRCVDLLSSAVSQAPKDVILKISGRSFPEFRPPDWLAQPNPSDPNYSANDYFNEVALSTLIEGNYFTMVLPDIVSPRVLTVLDPGRVRVRPGPMYDILDSDTGQVIATLGPEQMLHGWWIRPAGSLRGIAPLEVLRRTIGSARAADDYAGRYFGQGAALSFGVEVPTELTLDQKKQLSDALQKQHAGLRNSHAIGVLTGGAKFVGGLAPTPEQSQMLETRKFSVEDICRAFGVPPGMVGSQEPGASSYASAEVFSEAFRQYGVLPLATRIETKHDRLLSIPPDITAGNASIHFKFNLDGIVRASLTERATASESYVRGGIKTPNEARAKEDLPPIPGGDEVYMQMQMVPLSRLNEPQPVPTPQENPIP